MAADPRHEALIQTVSDTCKALGRPEDWDPEMVVAIFSEDEGVLEVRSVQFSRDPGKLGVMRRTSVPSAVYVQHALRNDLRLTGDELCYLERANPDPGSLRRQWVCVDAKPVEPVLFEGKIIATNYNPGPA